MNIWWNWVYDTICHLSMRDSSLAPHGIWRLGHNTSGLIGEELEEVERGEGGIEVTLKVSFNSQLVGIMVLRVGMTVASSKSVQGAVVLHVHNKGQSSQVYIRDQIAPIRLACFQHQIFNLSVLQFFDAIRR